MDTPTNTPSNGYVVTATGTGGATKWSAVATSSQTPWTSDIAGGNYSLTGVNNFYANVITNGGGTASRLAFYDANKKLISAAASGAVPVDADGSAATFAQINALAPSSVLTNGHSAAVTLNNTLAVIGNNVGIGAASPFSRATVTIPANNTISTSDSANTAGLTIAGTGALVRLQMGIGSSTVGPYGGWIQSSYDNGGAATGTEPLVINPLGGYVGIGTGSSIPRAQLDLGLPAMRGPEILTLSTIISTLGYYHGMFRDQPRDNDLGIATHHSGALVFGKTTSSSTPTWDTSKEFMRLANDGTVSMGGALYVTNDVTLVGADGDLTVGGKAAISLGITAQYMNTPTNAPTDGNLIVATGTGGATKWGSAFDSVTNAFGGAVFQLGASYTTNCSSTAAITFTGVANIPASTERWGQLTIMARGGNVAVATPASWFVSDGLASRTCTNGNNMVIALDVQPGIFTNAAIVQFWH